MKKIGKGNANIAVGTNALTLNTSGYSNVAIGKDALKNNTTGHDMVAIGDSALFNQTISGVYKNNRCRFQSFIFQY